MIPATTPATADGTTDGEARTGSALVVGEALIDVVNRPDGTVDAHPGGSPANVALTLGRLGRPVRLLTSFGRDAYGEQVRAWLDESSVELVPGSDDAERTSTATATLDATGSASYEFDITWPAPEAPATPSSADGSTTAPLVVHTGSIATFLEPGAAGVLELVRAARATSTITFDPNMRPSLLPEPDVVRPVVEAFIAQSDVVKASDEDLAWLFPDVDPVEVAQTWLGLGTSLVVVTLGGDGAVAVTAAGTVRVDPVRVDVVDTVGAGDSFMGALVDGLWHADLLGAGRRGALAAIDDRTVEAVLGQCVRVAAITVSRAGANPPRRHEVAATEL
nr:carbohydrate kinase [Luteimicrobium subarcticum]